MSETVLLWGLLGDPTFRAVYEALLERGVPVALLDHAAVGRMRVWDSTAEGGRLVSCDGQTLPLNEMNAAYLRPYDRRHYELAPEQARRSALVHQLMADWAEHSSATIVNRPSAEATNHCKLMQASLARACGFATPESILTNDPHELLAFHERWAGETVAKSLSSVRSVVREFSPGQLAGKERGGIGPAFVQQRIRGRGLRVHVVGERTFACEIQSEAIDYRYAPAQVSATTLDEQTAAACVEFTRRLGLLISGIDLIVTDTGEHYCLEANPNPGFSAFDPEQHRQVARVLAELLSATLT